MKEREKGCRNNERDKEREEVLKTNEGRFCPKGGFFDKYNQFTNLGQKQSTSLIFS